MREKKRGVEQCREDEGRGREGTKGGKEERKEGVEKCFIVGY